MKKANPQRKTRAKKKLKVALPAKIKGKKAATKGSRATKPRQSKSSKQKKAEGIKPFPIVGIGGSAGGLEAFTTLLQHLPSNLGMAYVYIQHLSPTHESFLPEIIQRKTKMTVHQVKDNMRVEKDHIYVIPAKNNLSIVDGKLRLVKQDKNKGHITHSIDYFLSSLAPLYQQNSIGILLSGTGTDGTMGMMAIKAEGGITFAQDESAKYQDMPHHAATMGYVDFVMNPEKIAQELALLIKHPYAVTSPNEFTAYNKNELNKIHMIMNSKRGVDFSLYKQSTIHRRILRRMALHKINNIHDYAQILRNNKSEVDALYQDLLIAVTNFFRDANLYQTLISSVLPSLFKNRKSNDPIRIWIPGCATGEEAISFAIVILEFLGEKAITTPVQMFATDLNEKAIEKARTGIYLKSALQNVSTQRLRRYFIYIDGKYQVVKSIRDMCIYAPHNLLKDPPFSRMDIISCQNVLIYLEPGQQNRIMHAFHYALKSTGFLLLGKSETIGAASDLFDQASKQYKVYTKRQVATPLQLDFISHSYPVSYSYIQENNSIPEQKPLIRDHDIEKETDKLLLSRYVPASVLVNKDLEILRFRGSTSRYLEPASGKASLHLLKMVKDELSFDLRTVIHKAKKEGRTARKEGIVLGANGGSLEIAIEAVPIKNGRDNFYLIVFKETGTVPISSAKTKSGSRSVQDKRIVNLEIQLKESKDAIKIMTEDFEATREELQSANEEVLSSNEELQSINEELETSKEELQSTNEELTTINEELQTRNSELKEAGDYTKAIIETMHESLLMLTGDLKVKNANKGFYQMFQETPEETEGFFLYDLGDHHWNIPELRRQLKMVQDRDIPFVGFEVTAEFPKIGVKSMLLNAQKFSKRELSESLILLSVQDITSRKQFENELKQKEEKFRLLVQNSSDIITVYDQDFTIKYQSPAIEFVLGHKPEERLGRNINMDSIVHPDDKQIKIDLLKKSLQNPKKNISGEFRFLHKKGDYRTIEAIFRNLLDDPKVNGIIVNYRDITERKMLELQKDEFIGIASHELKTPVTSIKAYTQILQEAFHKIKDKKSEVLLDKMNGQVDRLTMLIVDLLDFTRIEGGKLKFRDENYDLNELLLEVIEEMQRTTKHHKIERKLDKSAHMWGDRYRTGQVLTNLLNNAIKYSPDAEKVIVSSKSEKGGITVSVEDFGIGIDKKVIDNLFKRFFRVSDPIMNTFPGLGLGLYISSEIIKRQGGKIWVKSVRGKGSTFSFWLPVKKSE